MFTKCFKMDPNCPVSIFGVLKPQMTQYRPKSLLNSQLSVKIHFLRNYVEDKYLSLLRLRPSFEMPTEYDDFRCHAGVIVQCDIMSQYVTFSKFSTLHFYPTFLKKK
jgi:hypothetical protein